jgi:predicted phage tail protein
MTSRERGCVNYACFLGKTNIGKDDLHLSGGSEEIRIAPVLSGAKRGGVLQFIARRGAGGRSAFAMTVLQRRNGNSAGSAAP